MTNKTMTELNAKQPHLRDLLITIDGLNIVDIQVAGPGAWVPRMTVQLSGDMGLNKITGQRNVYLTAAEFLRATLLNNGTGDGKRAHTFVPHANVSREDLDGDFNAAIAVAERAVTRLMDVYKGVDPENDGKSVTDDHFEWYGKSLYIKVETVDFNLTEKYVADANTPIWKLNELNRDHAVIAQSLVDLVHQRGYVGDINFDAAKAVENPSFIDELDVRNTTVVENGGESLDVENEVEPVVLNVTKMFDGVLHKRCIVVRRAETDIFWVPETMNVTIKDIDDLTKIRSFSMIGEDAHGNYEWRVYDDGVNMVDETPDVRTETKLFDGVEHKLLVIPSAEDAVDMTKLWVPADMDVTDIKTMDDFADDVLLTCLSAKGEDPTEWRLSANRLPPNVLNETKLFDGIPYTPKYLVDENDTVTLWVKEGTNINASCLEEIPAEQRVLMAAETADTVAQWRLL